MEVGTVVTAKRECSLFNVGAKGVCYEIYTIGDRQGYSFIFENGGYDGFSPDEVEIFLEASSIVDFDVAQYNFANVLTLSKDYDNGVFNSAFQHEV